MRILQVTPVYHPDFEYGGPPRKIHALSRGLQERGHEVLVATFSARAPLRRDEAEVDGVRVRFVPWAGRGNWRFPLSTRGLEHAVTWAEVVQLYGLFNLICPAAGRRAKRLGRPTLLEPLGMYMPLVGRVRTKALYNRFVTEKLARGASRIFAASPLEAEHVRALVPREKIILRPNIVEGAGCPAPGAREAFRARLGLREGQKMVLFLGRISPVKNLGLLLRAFAEAETGGAALVLAGPSLEAGYRAELEAQIRSAGMGDRVLFAGALYGEEKAAALAAADLFVLPSVFESFGNAAVEAVRAGAPVLLSETCGVAPWIHGRAGLAVPATADALARGMERLLGDELERARLTSRREEFLGELATPRILDITEQAYREVLVGAGAAGYSDRA